MQTISFLIIHLKLKDICLGRRPDCSGVGTPQSVRLTICLRQICGSPAHQSHRWSHPAHSGGLGGFGAEFIKSQRGHSGREVSVLKQPPALHALGLQPLKILTQELDGIVVLAQTFIPVPLAPQPVGHARGVDPFLHSELAELNQADRQLQLGLRLVCVCVCVCETTM